MGYGINKPPLKFWQIWNMSFGFLGIQFGWGLQMANMSAIYEYLGAEPDQIPLLWLAAPLTGLIIQPIVGNLSDHTWNRLGRRRPYFLAGAILSSIALILMPNSPTLWMAAGLLWILDASINISMEPFRAFVADLLPERQRARGFAMQSLFIGLGAIIASALPWLLTNLFSVRSGASEGSSIPFAVKLSFYLGAVVFLTAVLWTIIRTREYPPEQVNEFKTSRKNIRSFFLEIFRDILHMPRAMRKLAWVQIFSWLGLFCMWLYFPVAVARNVFGAPNETSGIYPQGIEWAGLCFAMYSLVCFGFAFLLPRIARSIGMTMTHVFCLVCGAAGLLSVGIIHEPWLLMLSMTGVGIAWSSILSMPYAILSGSLPPEKTGVYMGIFNFFIVLPEIFASLVFGWVMLHILNNNRMAAVIAGGACLLIAAAFMLRVRDEGRGTRDEGRKRV
ncbi:MAG: MFS transporter [bacterium]